MSLNETLFLSHIEVYNANLKVINRPYWAGRYIDLWRVTLITSNISYYN